MSEEFPTLIGKFIHLCGAIEFLINNSIRFFSRDKLLSNFAIESPLNKRINLLRQLLLDRSEINKDEIESLCNELKKLSEQRNKVAHNPIIWEKPNGSGTEEILVLRNKPGKGTDQQRITKEDVKKLVKQTSQIIKKIESLIPDATKYEDGG
jgi:hypothetical protein